MGLTDVVVLAVYLLGVVALGVRYSGRQTNVQDYFLTTKRVPWWALLGSIAATETSTVTLISVPGYAFGGDLTFLQLALGYVLGKVLVAIVLMPGFFRGELLTAYQRLARRFGPSVGRLTAMIFLITRSLSDGFRLFATGLVLAVVLASVPALRGLVNAWLPSTDPANALLVVAVCGIGAATLAYTLLGGMTAVIWTDVVQLCVYLVGMVVVGVILLSEIPAGWHQVMATAQPNGKLVVFDFAFDLTRSYTFWSGLLGGMFLTASTHGADQMFVQRYLCSRSSADASRALVWSGFVVLAQFALLLAIGVMLWVYYTMQAPDELAAIMVDGLVPTDRVLPAFMMSHLPTGIRGLVVAAIVAAAMSTLSSSLNSSAASTVGDFYLPATAGKGRPASNALMVSRLATVGWCVAQVLVAIVAMRLSTRVVDEVLGIQSFTGGLLLGAFLLTLGSTRGSAGPVTGIVVGVTVLLGVRLFTPISWQWYVFIGAATTFMAGWLAGRLANRGARPHHA